MENIATSMYYTFSTIAQVLAAFLALSGVFTIYKIPQITKAQQGILDGFLKHFKLQGFDEFKAGLFIHAQLENFTLIADKLAELSKQPKITDLDKESRRVVGASSGIRIREIKKQELINLTKISMFLGVISIIYSLIIIPSIPCITNGLIDYKNWFIGVDIFVAVATILVMSYGIFASLQINLTEKIKINKNE